MEIKVFGPGCAKCTETENLVKKVAAEKGGSITVQKVSGLKEMMAAGVMLAPAVAVDGVMKSTGRVPRKDEVMAWIDGAESSAPSAVPADGCRSGEKS